jgi:hypothetical protein
MKCFGTGTGTGAFVRPEKHIVLLLCFLVLALAVPALAADEKPEVKLGGVQGLLGKYTADKVWLMRNATLENTTDATRQVKVVCVGEQASGRQELYSRIVKLLPHTLQRADIAVFTGDIKSSGLKIGGVEAEDANTNFLMSDALTGETLTKMPDITRRILPGIVPVCLLGENPAVADRTLVSQDIHIPMPVVLDRMFKKTVQVSPPNKAMTPDRWYGYSMTPVMFVGDIDTNTMRDSQIQAIIDWVRHGGILVLTGSKEFEATLRGPLGQAAGVTSVGSHRIMSLNVAGIGGKTMTAEYRDPQKMVELSPDQASVLFYADGLPLLTRRQFGSGWVFTLAVPLMGIANKAVTDVGGEIANVYKALPAVDQQAFPTPAKGMLNKIAGRQGPLPWVPALILAGLAAIGLLGGIVAWFWRRGELVWLGLVPLTLLTAVGIGIASQRQSDSQRLTFVGLTCGTGDGKSAFVQEVFAYGSGDQTRTVNLSSGGYRSVIWDNGQGVGVGSELDVRTGEAIELYDVAVDANSTRGFAAEGMVTLAGVQSDLTFGELGLAGRLTNGMAGMADAVVYANGKTFKLGDLPTGSEVNCKIGPEEMLGRGEFSADPFNTFPQRSVLLKELVQGKPGKRPITGPFLVGYTNQTVLSPMPGKDVWNQGWIAVVWPLDIAVPKPGSKVFLPPGFVNVQLGNQANNSWDIVGGRFQRAGLGGVDFLVSPPEQITLLKDARATITMLMQGHYKLRVVGIDQSGKEELLQAFDDCNGRKVIDVPQADRFATAGGKFTFGIRLQPQQASDGEEANSQEWILESADVALEGISK